MNSAPRYEILERVGQGGMGVVYRARDRLTQRVVALKYVAAPVAGETVSAPTHDVPSTTFLVSTDDSAAKAYKLALAKEFRILSSLRHPNIISVLDYGFDKLGEPFFTMELLETPVDLLTAGAALGLPARVELIAQLLRALAYLHRRGLLHRDIKPSNVCVLPGPEGPQVKLLDFGIAAHVASAAVLAGKIGRASCRERVSSPV